MRILIISVLLFFSQQLTAQNAYIQVNGEPGLSVFLNGSFKGKTTAELGGYIIENVKPGQNLIKIVKQGFTPFEETITVKPGEVLSYKVKPFSKHVVTISEEGNNAETDKKAKVETGKLIVQSVPIEIKLTMPAIEGVTNKAKTKDEWIADNIPSGEYKIIFTFNNKTIEKSVAITGNETTKVFVNMLSGEVQIKNSLDEKLQLQGFQQYVGNLARKYKYKNGLSQSEFINYNPESSKAFRKKGFKSNGTVSYSTTDGVGNPYSEGVSHVLVGTSYTVISCQYTVKSGNSEDVTAMFEQAVKEARNNIDEKYITKTSHGIDINVPGTGILLSIQKWNYNKWHAFAYNFAAKSN
jgi:hypothetical protein